MLGAMSRQPLVPPQLRAAPFTVVEARRAGLTWKQLQGASWRRVGGGLYAWAGLPLGPQLVLAAAHRRLPTGAAFSGSTAAWLHGLDLAPCDPVEITVPRNVGVAALAGLPVHRADLSPDQVVQRGGMPVTDQLRTMVDIGRWQPLVEAVVAMDMALRAGLVDAGRLEEFLRARRIRGVARVRQVLSLADHRSESPMETRLRLLLVLAGLSRPEARVPLVDDHGAFLGRPDLHYPERRLAIEYDGDTHRDRLVDDDRRQNRLLSAGFHVLRFTAADVLRRPDSVVALVRDALTPAGADQSVARQLRAWTA